MAIYAIDFDNTLAITRFPEIVAPNKKMVAFAKAVKAQGHQIILWTSRAGADLENAVEWCRLQGLVFDAVNEPLPEQIKRWGNDEAKCTACGACVKACPKAIIEIRPQGKKSRRVYVSCVNKDKGAVARKACTVSCIGCGKCVKTCPFEAITLENNLAYIDPNKCKSCRKCVEVCPQGTIIELNFPPRKPKAEGTLATEAPKAEASKAAPAAEA